MLTPAVMKRYRVLNHEPENREALIQRGLTRGCSPAALIAVLSRQTRASSPGSSEPHFFAGFSGGPKGIMPGVAGWQTIVQQPRLGKHQRSQLDLWFRGNPIWEEMRDIALRAGPSFLLNVTLNHQRQITGVLRGDLIEGHRLGCEFVKQSAMQRVEAPFEVVVTTNSGYPLDQNLYQGVKGMSAGARILKPGGTLIPRL